MKVFAAARGLPRKSIDLLVIPLHEGALEKKKGVGKPSPVFTWLDKSLKSRTRELLAKTGFGGKRRESCLLHLANIREVSAVLFITIPAEGGEVEKGFELKQAGEAIGKAAREIRAQRICVDWHVMASDETHTLLEALLEGVYLASYSFDKYRSASKEMKPFSGIEELTFAGIGDVPREVLRRAAEIDGGVSLARDLANTPASDCTPEAFVEAAKKLARSHKLDCHIYARADLRKLKAGGILSVSQGSSREPALISLAYKPKGQAPKKIAIVGKGVTFDTGGICIKPGAGMEEMKYDMGGAAAVLGAMRTIAALKPKVEVRAYLPVSENMVDGSGTHPGDIVRIMNGKTVEVINTDAEGRLLLADALSLAEREGCDEIIDLATLTGAIVIALGVDCAGLFSADDGLAGRLLKAASKAHERLWRMPLMEDYREQLKSTIADLKNIGDKAQGGGAITGALFLKEFVPKAAWAHLDIAGPVMRGGAKNAVSGATGYGVRTLVRYVMEQTEA